MAVLRKGFVDMNVRVAFENHTVEEMQEVKKKVSLEIEKKREDLRILVGESYRDLIDAADTIAVMKESSYEVVDQLKNFRLSIPSLPNTLTPAGGLVNYATHQRSFNPSEMEIAAELKVAFEAPRQLKTYLNQGKPVEALHLYLLTKQLQASEKGFRMPALHQLDWFFSKTETKVDPVKTMRDSILKFVEGCFQNFNATAESLAECFVVQQVLDGINADSSLGKFLEYQLKIVEDKMDKDTEDLVSAITFVLKSVYRVFIDPQAYVSAAKNVRKVKVDLGVMGIPFVPKFVHHVDNEHLQVDDAPRVSKLVEVVNQRFLLPLKTTLHQSFEAKRYLGQYTRMEELEDHKRHLTHKLKTECEDMSRIILGATKSFWNEYFVDVYHQKGKLIIQDALDKISEYLQNTGFPEFKKLEAEFDLVNFVWTPQSKIRDSIASNITSSDSDDDMQWKGVSPHVAGLCHEINTRCSNFLTSAGTTSDTVLKDHASLYLEKTLSEVLGNLDVVETKSALFLGRFCSTLIYYCPSLWKILRQNEIFKFRQRLTDVSEKCFTQWSSQTLRNFEENLCCAKNSMTLQSVSKFMPLAEEFISEDESSLKPSVRIPVQLSHALQTHLFAMCANLCNVGPQTIPKSVRDNHRLSIGASVSSVYETYSEAELNPQVALQFIFDLKFVQWFHPNLNPVIDPVVKKLEARVDPFDLDIVYPKLKSNIKRALFENHLTVGLLFSEESHGFIAQNFKTKTNKAFPITLSELKVALPLLPV